MSTTSTTGTNSASALAATTGLNSSKKSSLGQSDFLKLLVTQLQHQDPLNPMDDKEFVAELSQFSSLEQLTNVNTNLKTLTSVVDAQAGMSVVGFIGKQVRASGSQVAKSGTSVGSLYFNLSDAAKNVTVNVFDANGNIVRTVDMGSMTTGDKTFTWDGKDSNGNSMADGTYTMRLGAVKADGTSILVSTDVSGVIKSASFTNGSCSLKLDSGISVQFSDIKQILDSSSSSASTTK